MRTRAPNPAAFEAPVSTPSRGATPRPLVSNPVPPAASSGGNRLPATPALNASAVEPLRNLLAIEIPFAISRAVAVDPAAKEVKFASLPALNALFTSLQRASTFAAREIGASSQVVTRMAKQAADASVPIPPMGMLTDRDRSVAAVAAGDAELADKLAAGHAAQIVRQIQSYIARDTTSHISLAS